MTLSTNLVSFYKLDANSNDSVGSNNGTDTAISYATAGKIGNCATFNGTTSTIAVGSTGFPSGNGARSMSLWVKPTSLPSSGIYTELFSYGNGSSNDRNGIYLHNNGGTQRIDFGIYGADLEYTTTLPTTSWSYLTVTHDGTTARLYLNGSEVVNGARTLSTTATGASFARDITFNGGIDETAIWSRALTADEVSQIYNSGRGNAYPLTDTPSLYGGVAYYKLDESSGNASDSIGSNTLTNNGTTVYAAGKINNGITLNGSSQYMSSTSSTFNFERTNPFTISAWVKTTQSATTNEYTIYGKLDVVGGYRGIELVQYYNTTKFGVNFRSTFPTNQISLYGSTTINDGNFHLVTVTYSGSSTAAGILLYVDGNLETKTVLADTLSATILNATQMEVGRRSNASQYWNGQIDEMGIWNRALSSTEVIALYNSGNGSQYPFSTIQILTRALADTMSYAASRLITLSRSFSGLRTLSDSMSNAASRFVTLTYNLLFMDLFKPRINVDNVKARIDIDQESRPRVTASKGKPSIKIN